MSVTQSGDQANFITQGTFNNVSGDQYNQSFIQDSRSTESILRRLRPAHMDASHRTGCLPGTRTKWTQFVMDWALDSTEKRNVLWIYGLAGSGKSTLATEVANQLRQLGHLGAFVFFERDVMDRSEPLVVIRTIAYELGVNQTQLRDVICAAVERQSNLAHFPLESQFRQLLVKPILVQSLMKPQETQKSSFRTVLRQLFPGKSSETPQTIVLILDAFDECGTPEKRKSLVRILSELTKEIPYLRFLITSRPERDIRGAFEHQSHVLSRELDTSSHDSNHDISTYLTIRINEIKAKSLDLREQTDWPCDEALQLLVRRASGLFIWATTAAHFIDAYSPKARLRLVLQDSSQVDVGRKLDILYQTALQSAGSWDDPEFVQDFRSIMAVVLAAACPLSANAIDQLRKRDDNHQSCIHLMSHLGCLLQQRPVIRLLHPSFADFLFTRSRCDREYWVFDQIEVHRDLAARCINHLNKNLRTNICNLVLSPGPVNERLPEDLEYVCMYWVEHVCRANSADPDIVQSLHGFLMQHLLHWIEAMSILKMTRDAIGLLQRLSTWLSNLVAVEIKLSELIHDGVRFIQRHAELIEIHPLHIYASALPFTPPDTLLYNLFHDPLCHPMLWGSVEKSWSPFLQVLIGHSASVTSVAISPDSTRIVSGSDDHTIRVWDATSGIEVLPELTGHNRRVVSVAFSPDGTRIASGSCGGMIRLWDASSGVEVLPPMRGHTDSDTISVVFSHDGKFIISGAYDKTIRVWDASSGAEVRQPLEGHTGSISSVSCSQTRIASGSSDKTIRVWDIASGLELLPPLQGHTDRVNSVAFSPNGGQIASGSNDGTIRLWDSNTGVNVVPPFKGHSSHVVSVAFSPDGTRIVSAARDNTIRLWDISTGIECTPPLVYTSGICSVAFSPDGARIISGSRDSTVQTWDATSTPEPILSSGGHTKSVNSLAFSPDGTRLVTGSADGTTRIWDTASGVQFLPPMKKYGGPVNSVAFSPGGAQIVSGSHDGTVRTWDAITGREILSILQGDGDSILAVAFSPNGKRIASGSYRGLIHVWDATTGLAVLPPLKQSWPVESVAFSSNGLRLVSHDLQGYENPYQYTWDMILGALIYKNAATGPMPTGGDLKVDLDSGWIRDRLTKTYFCQLPLYINLRTQFGICYAVHGRTFVVGTDTDQFFMRIPTGLPSQIDSPTAEYIDGEA